MIRLAKTVDGGGRCSAQWCAGRRMLENLATVRDGVTSWGPSMAVAFATPDTEVAASARAGWVASNLEKAAAASVRHRVRRGTSEIWALAGAHHNAWRHPDVRFYSPLALSRLDAGVEWTRWLHPPRFRADRRRLWSVRYLAGADSDGEILSPAPVPRVDRASPRGARRRGVRGHLAGLSLADLPSRRSRRRLTHVPLFVTAPRWAVPPVPLRPM